MIAQFSEAEATHALIAELCSGRKFMEENQKYREDIAAKEAAQHVGHKVTTALGKHIASIPQHEFMLLIDKYGYDEVHSKGFMHDFQRFNPDLKSNRV